jgi:hypothetical protein
MSIDETRQKLAKWLVVWWWIAVLLLAPLYFRLLWEMTLLTWMCGPQMIGFSFIHLHSNLFGIGILGLMLAFAWLPSAAIYLLVKKKRPAKSTIAYFGIFLTAFALYWVAAILASFLGSI